MHLKLTHKRFNANSIAPISVTVAGDCTEVCSGRSFDYAAQLVTFHGLAATFNYCAWISHR